MRDCETLETDWRESVRGRESWRNYQALKKCFAYLNLIKNLYLQSLYVVCIFIIKNNFKINKFKKNFSALKLTFKTNLKNHLF